MAKAGQSWKAGPHSLCRLPRRRRDGARCRRGAGAGGGGGDAGEDRPLRGGRRRWQPSPHRPAVRSPNAVRRHHRPRDAAPRLPLADADRRLRRGLAPWRPAEGALPRPRPARRYGLGCGARRPCRKRPYRVRRRVPQSGGRDAGQWRGGGDGMTRAVVTGPGCVTPIGKDVGEFWQSLTSGRSGVRRITLFDPSALDCQIAAEVKDWDPTRYMEAKVARRAARFSQFAIAAARQAVDDSGLRIDDRNRDDVAVVMNTGGGGVDIIADSQTVFIQKGPDRVGPMTVPAMAPNMASCQVAMTLGTRGPTITSVAACAAGIFAFVEAKRLIDLGEADVVVTGGAEANIIPVALAAMSNMRALSTRNDEPEKACRPFDLNRDGFVYGEGAAAAVVESLEHAQRRGARVYAELAGGAVTSG